MKKIEMTATPDMDLLPFISAAGERVMITVEANEFYITDLGGGVLGAVSKNDNESFLFHFNGGMVTTVYMDDKFTFAIL